MSSQEPPRLARRIVVLFAPHRGRLGLIAGIILVTSASSVVSALLVQRVFDHALFVRGGPDLHELYPLVSVLVAIPIVNGVLNVAQTYLTEVVGNRVLQELRERLLSGVRHQWLARAVAWRPYRSEVAVGRVARRLLRFVAKAEVSTCAPAHRPLRAPEAVRPPRSL